MRAFWRGKASRTVVGTGLSEGPWPRIAVDESFGTIRIHDPRVFREGRRSFCRRWLQAAGSRPGVRKASVDLATATGLMEFEPLSESYASMASAFSTTVREALASPSDDTPGRLDWVALTAFEGSADPSDVWEITGRSTRRLRLRHRGLHADPDRLSAWIDRIAAASGVVGCRERWMSDELTIAFDPSVTNEVRLLADAQDAWSAATVSVPARRTPRRSGSSVPATRWGRGVNLAKAGVAFGLTGVALLIPGVPTVPFLLATSYYLARSSPRLNEALLNSALLGPILRDWETYRALSPGSKGRLIGLTVFVILVTVSVSPLGPVGVAVVLLIGSASVYAIAQLPEPEGLSTDRLPALSAG